MGGWVGGWEGVGKKDEVRVMSGGYGGKDESVLF